MTKEEGNVIISKFDGWVKLDDFVNSDNETFPYYMKMVNDREEFIHYIPNNYHLSWGDLMPVVEKIAKIKYYDLYSRTSILDIVETAYPMIFGMINNKTGEFMVRISRCSLFQAPTLIEATWLAVVDFLGNKYNK